VPLSVWILTGVYALSNLDRNIVNILVEPIKRDLGLPDWEFGIITGLAFSLLYTVLGIPIARYADRPQVDRVRLIWLCISVWSFATALCGGASSYFQLLTARVVVGMGEAGASPSAHSLIADIVPIRRRA